MIYQSINGYKYILPNSLYFNVIDKVFPQYLQLDVVFIGPSLSVFHSFPQSLLEMITDVAERTICSWPMKIPMQYLVTILVLILLLTFILMM